MTSLLHFDGTPNLLELVDAGVTAVSLGDLSIYGDELGRLPCGLADLSLCGDEGADGDQMDVDTIQSPCADEFESDVRLKTDIEKVGTTVYGLPLYHFRYKTGRERFLGVMAQDVLQVMPNAVVRGEDGYYRVKYAELGIRMTRA